MNSIEAQEVLEIVEEFYRENSETVQRVMALFPRSRTGVLAMALDCGVDRLIEICDFEDDCAKGREARDARWYARSTAGRSVAGTPRSPQSWS